MIWRLLTPSEEEKKTCPFLDGVERKPSTESGSRRNKLLKSKLGENWYWWFCWPPPLGREKVHISKEFHLLGETSGDWWGAAVGLYVALDAGFVPDCSRQRSEEKPNIMWWYKMTQYQIHKDRKVKRNQDMSILETSVNWLTDPWYSDFWPFSDSFTQRRWEQKTKRSIHSMLHGITLSQTIKEQIKP